MRLSLGLLAALLLSGCASSHVLVGQARAPISAEEVTLYIEPPARYETIALLEASNRGKMNWTEQGRTNTVIWRLKEEAAALGANGIIIQGMGHQYAGSVGSGNAWASGNSAYGVGFSSAITNRVGNGLAIYVPVDSRSGTSIDSTPVATDLNPDAADQPTQAPPTRSVEQPYERDPAKRCDACERLLEG